MTVPYTFMLAPDLQRGAVTIEIWIEGERWAVLVEHEDGAPFVLETFSRSDGQRWAVPLADATALLARAEQRFMRLRHC